MCEKGEFCEFGDQIRGVDKHVVAAGFNIFIFLYNFKEVDPANEALLPFDPHFKNDRLYKKMKDRYMKEVQ